MMDGAARACPAVHPFVTDWSCTGVANSDRIDRARCCRG